MIRTPRRFAVAATVGVAALALSGCGSSPVHSGAAATVGSERITTTALAALVSRGLADPQAQQQLGADRAGFQRQSLARLINHDVLVAAAKTRNVSITEGAVDARLADFARQAGGEQQLAQQASQNGIARQDLRRFVSDLVLNDALGEQLTTGVQVPQAELQALYDKSAGQTDQVHAAHILVATQARAQQILAKVKADPASFAGLAARFSLDKSNKDKGGDLGIARRGQFVKPFEAAVFGAKAGDYLMVRTQFGFHVVHVIERRSTTLEQELPALRRAALQRQRRQLTGDLLRKVARQLGVRVNPRFGRWDGTSGSVIPVPQNASSVSSPAPGSGAPGQQPGAAPVG